MKTFCIGRHRQSNSQWIHLLGVGRGGGSSSAIFIYAFLLNGNVWVIYDFTPFSPAFQLHQEDGKVIIKGCKQWNLVYGWRDFSIQWDSNRDRYGSVRQRLTYWGIPVILSHCGSALTERNLLLEKQIPFFKSWSQFKRREWTILEGLLIQENKQEVTKVVPLAWKNGGVTLCLKSSFSHIVAPLSLQASWKV